MTGRPRPLVGLLYTGLICAGLFYTGLMAPSALGATVVTATRDDVDATGASLNTTPVPPGGTYAVRTTIANQGSQTAQSVELSEMLPSNVTAIAWRSTPLAANDYFATCGDIEIVVDGTSGVAGLTANDRDIDLDTVTVVSPLMNVATASSLGGSFTITDSAAGFFTYTPPGGVELMTDVVNYAIADDDGNLDSAEVQIWVGDSASCGSIRGQIWLDRDADALRGGSEPGLSATVQLLEAAGIVIATDQTAANGAFLLDKLPPGDFMVRVDRGTLSPTSYPTYDQDGTLDHRTAATLALGENLANVDFGYADMCLPTIDFEADGFGVALAAGQIMDDELAALGIQISTDDPINHPAMIFDSSNPSGGDFDLGTPNQTFGGAGIGAGGEPGQPGENAIALGNVLIISEDADSSDPDDSDLPGTLIITFAGPVQIANIGLLSVGGMAPSTVTAFDVDGTVITDAMIAPTGANAYHNVPLNAGDVRRLEVYLQSGGAVTHITFCEGDCRPVTVRDLFDAASFANNDGPDDWAGNWIENDPESGGAGPNAGQVRISGGLMVLDDYPNTGGEPSLAREVDLSQSTGAFLSFEFTTGSGVDSSDAVTVEASADGGVNWSTLEVITGISGSVQLSRDFDITSFISAQTQVRFRVSNLYGGENETFGVSEITIASVCPGSCTPITVREEFSDAAFGNNDGPDDWAGSWIEDDPQSGGAGPAAGQVRISGGFMVLDDYPNTGGEPSLAREVDLSRSMSALLSFEFVTGSGVDLDEEVTVEVSADGGANWSTLEVITNISGVVQETRQFDITSFISEQTQVRFRVSNKYGGSDESFGVDWVEVAADCAP